LKTILIYDNITDAFCNITSKYLPHVENFRMFWVTTITYNEQNDLFNDEIELGELCNMFKKWSPYTHHHHHHITETTILGLLQHYYHIELHDNKFIHAKCSLWDKPKDIDLVLEEFRHNAEYNSPMDIISIDELYSFYLKFTKQNKYKFVVNKLYFEKYIHYKLNPFLVFEKFISCDWITEKV
jgi:hypothetical protein